MHAVETLAELYVAVIRAAHPEGPYHLLGWSFGGFIAFEMARRLRAEGCEVGMVAVMDAHNPYLIGHDDRDEVELLSLQVRDELQFAGLPVTLTANDLRAMDEGELYDRAAAALQAQGLRSTSAWLQSPFADLACR